MGEKNLGVVQKEEKSAARFGYERGPLCRDAEAVAEAEAEAEAVAEAEAELEAEAEVVAEV